MSRCSHRPGFPCVDEAGRLDPLQVRRSAERFAPDRVAVGYEHAYRAAMQREPVGALH
jgi:hypothetical protein